LIKIFVLIDLMWTEEEDKSIINKEDNLHSYGQLIEVKGVERVKRRLVLLGIIDFMDL
jgi:hypothetical protein